VDESRAAQMERMPDKRIASLIVALPVRASVGPSPDPFAFFDSHLHCAPARLRMSGKLAAREWSALRMT